MRQNLALRRDLFSAGEVDASWLQSAMAHLEWTFRARTDRSRPEEAEKLYREGIVLCKAEFGKEQPAGGPSTFGEEPPIRTRLEPLQNKPCFHRGEQA